MTGLWKDSFLHTASRGAYTIQALEQMLHGKSWGNILANLRGNIDQVNFQLTIINVISNVIEQ